MPASPVAMWLFWTYAPVFGAWAIGRITGLAAGQRWGHMGVGWDMDDGTSVYGEALVADDVVMDRPIRRLLDFVAKGGGRRAARCVLPVSPAQAQAAYTTAWALQRRSSYSVRQLLQMWAFERLGRRVPHDPVRVVCSEFASLCADAAGVELRDPRRINHDEVTPASAMRRCVFLHLPVEPISPAQ